MQKKVIKRMIKVVASVCSLFTLTGCGSGSTDDTASKTESSKSNEIVFWHPLTGDDGAYMKRLVDGYNDTNPDMKIKEVPTPEFYTKLQTVFSSQKGLPDLAIVHAVRIPIFQEKGMISSVDELQEYQPELKKENYLEPAWNYGSMDDGKQYSIPLDMIASPILYNIDLLEKYDAMDIVSDNVVTIDEVLELNKKLPDNIVALTTNQTNWQVYSLLADNGGDTHDGDKPLLNSPEMIKTVTELRSINDAGGSNANGDDPYALFQAGEAVFHADGTWTLNAHQSIDGLNFGIANAISSTPDHAYNRVNSHNFAVINKEGQSDEKKKGMAAFLEYVRENSIIWAECGSVPASKDVVDSDEFKEMPQNFLVSDQEQIDRLKTYDFKFAGYWEDSLGEFLNDILYGNLSVEDGLAQAQKSCEDKIAEYNK